MAVVGSVKGGNVSCHNVSIGFINKTNTTTLAVFDTSSALNQLPDDKF